MVTGCLCLCRNSKRSHKLKLRKTKATGTEARLQMSSSSDELRVSMETDRKHGGRVARSRRRWGGRDEFY